MASWFLLTYIFIFITSVLSTAVIRSYALKKSLIDIPNDRSSHEIPTPRGGGLAFIIVFLGALLILKWIPEGIFSPDLFLFLVLIPLAIIGFLDDRYNLPSSLRYPVQLSSAIVAVWHYGSFPQPWLNSFGATGVLLAMVLTAIGFTALVNFYNFMDGLDGLITTIVILQLSFIALYLQQPIWWLLIAALLGFLYWNWSPAKIFMGDVGSTVLGAVVAIALIQAPNASMGWSVLAITLPVTADTIYTLGLRLSRKENIFQAHRGHLYQRLQQAGWSHPQVTLAYGALTMVLALLISLFGQMGAIASLGLTLTLIPMTEAHLLRQSNQP